MSITPQPSNLFTVGTWKPLSELPVDSRNFLKNIDTKYIQELNCIRREIIQQRQSEKEVSVLLRFNTFALCKNEKFKKIGKISLFNYLYGLIILYSNESCEKSLWYYFISIDIIVSFILFFVYLCYDYKRLINERTNLISLDN